MAWKLDRISRSSMDTETLLRRCLERGKRIVCVDDGIDTDTQMGQVWVKLASIFAEVERNAIKEGTTHRNSTAQPTSRTRVIALKAEARTPADHRHPSHTLTPGGKASPRRRSRESHRAHRCGRTTR
ncbi:recombinase family protein [Mycolicibacterium frederiksbergense]|uniref:recombinase family protein n=1 Tax=Mycolicibacterium frederiksbergense TaxID=117567 RepID=UPI003557F88F